MMFKWKVIIADDETIIREGIRDSIDWDTLDMRVVAEATHGKEALEMGIEHQADIMVVDLNMPIMNGITLISHLREKLAACRIIIISGHDEFHLAQEAIRLGVDDYILKPANPSNLTEVLLKLAISLEASQRKENHLSIASRQLEKNIVFLRERFCLEWITGTLNEEEIMEQVQFLQLPNIPPQWVGVIHWQDNTSSNAVYSERDRQLFLYAIDNIAGEILKSWESVVFRNNAGLIIILLWDCIPNNVWIEIQESIRKYLKIPTIYAFANVQNGELGISDAYKNACSQVFQASQVLPIVHRAQQYLQLHYANPSLSQTEVADEIKVSSVYLSRIFKQTLELPFVTFLTNIRIQKATQLLNSTDLSIKDISEQVGFESQHYFSTSFKKKIGISPLQYRQGDNKFKE